jgi:hypothetical protein
MAVISNYNPTLHDIYLFNQSATVPSLPRSNPPGSSCLVQATGYNPNNLLLDSRYNFPSIDWSGLHVRRRGMMSYGWSNPQEVFRQYNNMFTPLQYGDYTCYTTGNCNDTQWNNIQYNYNLWNNGQIAFILISPQHVLACDHYIGPNTITDINFIGKDGTIYPTKQATKVAALVDESRFNSQSSWYPNCIRIGDNRSNDYVLFKLDTKLTDQELQNIKIYPFVKTETIRPNTTIFTQDPNGKLLLRRFLNAVGTDDYIATEYLQNEENTIPIQTSIHVGDSGSPMLINVNGETAFFGNRSGGEIVQRNNILSLIEYIRNDIGYEVRLLDGGYVSSTIPDISPFTPLTTHPYLSRYSTKNITLDFNFLAFKSAFQLQASELNELQEIFWIQQSKTIEMMHHWFGFNVLSKQTNTGPTNLSNEILNHYSALSDKSCLSNEWSILIPINPSQVTLAPNSNVQFNTGWYFLKNKTNEYDFTFNAYKWIYLSGSLLFNATNSTLTTLTSTNVINKCSIFTSTDQISLFLQDNTYFSEASFRPCGADRFSTSIDITLPAQILTVPANPTNKIPSHYPIIFYTDENGKSFLPNGYEIK